MENKIQRLLIVLCWLNMLAILCVANSTAHAQKIGKLFIERINIGGLHYTDDNGREWLPDQDYSPGSYGSVGYIYTAQSNDLVKFTANSKLYQTAGQSMAAYKIDVPIGHYKIYLHFTEFHFEENNKRVMDVKIEGKTVLRNLDIHSQAGHDAPLTYMFATKDLNCPVTDGIIDIEFIPKKDETIVSAIEVLQDAQKIECVPPHADFGMNETSVTTQIYNFDIKPLNWSIAPTSVPAWLSISPMQGSLGPGEGKLVSLTAKRPGVTGLQKATLRITGQGFKSELAVRICAEGPSRLKLVQSSLDFGTSERSLPLLIENSGGSPLAWSIEPPLNANCVTRIFPQQGTLEAGGLDYINISIDRKTLAAGLHRAALKLNSGGGAQAVDVRLNVPATSVRHIFVDDDATGAGTGGSWEDAFNNIAEAIESIAPTLRGKSAEIWVAEGTYYEHDILVKQGVQLYGGFRGDESYREERRNPLMYPSIIDGQRQSGCLECEHRTVVDGFTIRNGRVWKGGDGNGAGILAHDVDVKITNNVFYNNIVSWAGAAIFIEGYEFSKNVRGFSPLIEHNLIINNRATYCAAGIEIRGSQAVIRNNTIANNFGHGLEIQVYLGPLKNLILGDFDNNIVIGNRRNMRSNIWAAARKCTDYSFVEDKWHLGGNFPPYTHGKGNIFAEETGTRPNFIDPMNGDYHLMAGSPCIDVGNPQTERDADQTPADIGAFAFNQTRSELVAAPLSLDFGTWQIEKSILLKCYGAGTVNWAARTQADVDWISAVEPASGKLENGDQVQISIGISRAGLDDGRYSGTIALMTETQSLEVPVEMLVNTLKPEINISTKSIDLTTPMGDVPPEAEPIAIANVGPGQFAWRASVLPAKNQANWIRLLKNNGLDGEDLEFDLSTGGLRYGDHRQIIRIQSDDAVNNPVLIPVTLRLTPPKFLLRVEAESNPMLPKAGWTVSEIDGDQCIQAAKEEVAEPNALQQLDYEFTVPEGVDFIYIFAEFDANDAKYGNSYWIKINGYDLCNWNYLHVYGSGWQRSWIYNEHFDKNKQHQFTVVQGKNTLNLFPREAGGFINFFVITNDPKFDIYEYY
ncbi:DUF1565 domain-containing protein [candidate division KSB1 bacterium]|nr:DUF1565 domain-containing protein [candidate division KSB1 bacterium]